MNLSHWIEQNAAFAPNKAAIHFEGRTLSYRLLAKEIAQTAQCLKARLGIGRGDRIALLGYNSPEALIGQQYAHAQPDR